MRCFAGNARRQHELTDGQFRNHGGQADLPAHPLLHILEIFFNDHHPRKRQRAV